MKGMFKVIACALSLMAMSAMAAEKASTETLVCKQYGFTDKAEKFHHIKASKKESSFEITAAYVMHDGVKYTTVNPGWVGLDGLAITYHTDKNNKLLYLYVTDAGEREVGISSLELDSDAIFQDKAVYKDCHFKEEVVNESAGKVSRTNTGAAQATLPVYVL